MLHRCRFFRLVLDRASRCTCAHHSSTQLTSLLIRHFASARPKRPNKQAASKAATKAITDDQREPEPEPSPVAADSASAALARQYQKKTQREHILLRPEPYIGSTQPDTRTSWVWDDSAKRMAVRAVTVVPGLVHVVDEILVNAADNRHRKAAVGGGSGSATGAQRRMSYIDIVITPTTITIKNDGQCIPVLPHPEHRIYIPELIFGHLLTSSNYDDSQQRLVGGRHGYGAKLVNIFSHAFAVELQDEERQVRYRQQWRSNMSERDEPAITPYSALSLSTAQQRRSYTSVSFTPDLSHFHCDSLGADTLALLHRRAYDIAATVASDGVQVRLNGQPLPVQSFSDYVSLFPVPTDAPPLWVRVGDWEIAVCGLLGGGVAAVRDVSFVNSIQTSRGGTHVQAVSERVTKLLVDEITKRHKLLSEAVTAGTVRQFFSLFINTLVPNPSFDSQTKETLITPARSLPPLTLPPAFVKQLLSSRLLDSIVEVCETKQSVELARKLRQQKAAGSRHRQLLSIPKLTDATLAAHLTQSHTCTLILTEGDSAKALVLAGLSELGRERWGVFPLRGKLLNVRDVGGSAMVKNEEIGQLISILGLEWGRAYDTLDDVRTLRYGGVMLMCDQDHDGSHIKGLFINLLHTFWPSLLRSPHFTFLHTFSTAIVKVRKGGTVHAFDSIKGYREWQQAMGAEAAKWTVKYYKGLGTNTAEEGRAYFRQVDKHRVGFVWEGEQDDRAIEMAFSKSAADARKQWLQSYSSELSPTYLPPPAHEQSQSKTQPAAAVGKYLAYREFINKELILFSHADNIRSIPSVMDGLKPVQRKILYAAFRRQLTADMKVAQLAGYVAEVSGYHHGEASVSGAIVGMAQQYVGSNNLPLLRAEGQFGTRHLGGKDAASSRYIFTKLDALTRLLFDELDDALLSYRDEDGQSVEPDWYVPVIPMALVNGVEGIGTGFSTYVPSFHPLQLVRVVRRLLKGEVVSEEDEAARLVPWARGHRGVVRPADSKGVWVSEGVVRKVDDTTVEVSELPFGRWTQDYKDWLSKLASGDGPFTVRRVVEYHTNEQVRFRVELSKDHVSATHCTRRLRAPRDVVGPVCSTLTLA